MPTLLAIESSPRGDYSISRTLTGKFVDTWKTAHADGTVVLRDLQTTDLPFVDLPWIAGAYTPAEKHNPEMKKALEVSNTLIAELKSADHIIIGTSMYNFGPPANLKAWIDHIVRINETFAPTGTGVEGLVKGKKATIIIASGSNYAPGEPFAPYNLESGYFKQVLGFIGITDVEIVLAGGTGAIDRGQTSRDELLGKYTPAVEAAARA